MTEATRPHIKTVKPLEFDSEVLRLIELGVAKVKNVSREELEEIYKDDDGDGCPI